MSTERIEQIRQAGIVGAGGAGFPTHVKLDAKAEIVIINGAECEPLLRVDQQLMERYPERLFEAVKLIMEIVEAKEGVIALKEHYHGAVEALNKAAAGFPDIRIHTMGSFYPAGDEQVLVQEVSGKIVPEGGIPLHCGTVVTNVETALNIWNALEVQTPVTETYVTITGEVREPKTLRLPLGMTVGEAINLAGGTALPAYRIINGGPMMGKLVKEDALITKTTKGLIVLPEDHPLILSLTKPLERSLKLAAGACMQCSQCSITCPRGLLGHRIEPHKLMRVAGYGSVCDTAFTIENAFLCCECRLCEYSCVMDLQPWKLNHFLKEQMMKHGIRNSLHQQPEHADEYLKWKRYPTEKLIRTLGLTKYDRPAPLTEEKILAGKVQLSLRQGAGAPSVPCINAGDYVKAGDMVAQIPEGKLGSAVHASISGKVTTITEDRIVIEES